MCKSVRVSLCVCVCSHMQMSIGCHIKFNVLPALLPSCFLPFPLLLSPSSFAAFLVNSSFGLVSSAIDACAGHQSLRIKILLRHMALSLARIRNAHTLRIRQVYSLSVIILWSNKHLNANVWQSKCCINMPPPSPLAADINS